MWVLKGHKMNLFICLLILLVIFLSLINLLGKVDGTTFDAGVGEYDPDEFEGFEPVNGFEDIDAVDEIYEGGLHPNGDSVGLEDDDEFAYDEAEDEEDGPEGGFSAGAGAATGASKASGGTTIKRAGRLTDRIPARFTVWEYCGVVFILIYAVAYLFGRQENQKIASAWTACMMEFFEEQFAECGPATDQPREVTGSSEPLFKESQNEFLFYATGRRFCQGCIVRLQLKPRHDLFAQALALINLTPSGPASTYGTANRDVLSIEVAMNNEDMDPFVFACARRKDLRAMHSGFTDLKNYTGMSSSDSLPQSLALVTDCQDLTNKILHPPVTKAIKTFTEYFHSMHFTDQNTEPVLGHRTVPAKVLRFKFFLPKVQEMAQLSRLVEMSVHFIDHVAKDLKLSQQNRSKANERRTEVAERLFRRQHESRQEEMARRKTEKLRRERTAYEMMTAEQKAKYDAKEDKKKAKALQKNKMKMKRV
mmetsp:Transcript_16149/g.21368  ORF Transcript_16149/g.21368 Transcript_16149/m.21368 type:complete len:478 (-) Transcript_16149:348-1781(-)